AAVTFREWRSLRRRVACAHSENRNAGSYSCQDLQGRLLAWRWDDAVPCGPALPISDFLLETAQLAPIRAWTQGVRGVPGIVGPSETAAGGDRTEPRSPSGCPTRRCEAF